MLQPDGLQIGDLVELSGGYSFEPEWLAGVASVGGSVITFIPGQNETPAAVIKLDGPISYGGMTGDILVLELRYVGASWEPSEIVHVELCDFMPEAMAWQHRGKGKWAESHASYKRIGG
jgi:hypothetical protein